MQALQRQGVAGTLAGPAKDSFTLRKPDEEFHDLRSIPLEVRNLAVDPAHASEIARQREAMAGWSERVSDKGIVLEDELPE